jgi:hypothetical protein
VDSLLENARRIFDVARSGWDSSNPGAEGVEDFALMVRPDGALHFVMETPFSIEAAAIHAGAQSAWRVTRSREGVRVQGRDAGTNCVIEERNPRRELCRDQPLYVITPPLLTSCSTAS